MKLRRQSEKHSHKRSGGGDPKHKRKAILQARTPDEKCVDSPSRYRSTQQQGTEHFKSAWKSREMPFPKAFDLQQKQEMDTWQEISPYHQLLEAFDILDTLEITFPIRLRRTQECYECQASSKVQPEMGHRFLQCFRLQAISTKDYLFRPTEVLTEGKRNPNWNFRTRRVSSTPRKYNAKLWNFSKSKRTDCWKSIFYNKRTDHDFIYLTRFIW